MNECMKQLIQAVQSGQLDPNMTLGQLAQELMARSKQEQKMPEPQEQPAIEPGLGQVQ